MRRCYWSTVMVFLALIACGPAEIDPPSVKVSETPTAASASPSESGAATEAASPNASSTTPACGGEWYGYEDTFNRKVRNKQLEGVCAPDGFTRYDPVEARGGCESGGFDCLCENMGKKCETVCNFEGRHGASLCSEPGRDGLGNAWRVACCS